MKKVSPQKHSKIIDIKLTNISILDLLRFSLPELGTNQPKLVSILFVYQFISLIIHNWPLLAACPLAKACQYSLVDAHLIATTLPGPGQHYKLYMRFCYCYAQACLGKGK